MSIRTARVAEEIQKVLGERLVRGLRDPLPGFVTIRAVEVTSDFAHAKVFVSVFGSDDQKQGAIEGLCAQRGVLRKEVGSKVRLRLTPELTFVLDESGERAARVHALLDAVKDGKPAPHVADDAVTPKKKKPAPASKKPTKRAGSEDDDKDDADDAKDGGQEA
jgi:ribosome-binding factor A